MPTAHGDERPVVFKFGNLGPITSAEMELGDITIIAGRNNTGKTYLAYTLYGFLKTWDTWPGAIPWPFGSRRSRTPTIFEQVFRQVSQHGHATVSVTREALGAEREDVLRRSTTSFPRSALTDVFNSPPDTFENATIDVDLDPAFSESADSIGIHVRSDETLSIRFDENTIRVTGDVPRRPIPELDLARHVSRLYLRFLLPELPFDPFVLPAERLSISIFGRELDFSKSQLVDLLQKFGGRNEKEDPSWLFSLVDQTVSRYTRPIKDNIDYTRSLPDLRNQRSEIYGASLFNYIKKLTGGYYTVSGDGAIEFRSVARGDRRFSIPIHLASSSARGLSDLYFFLRHVARENQLLIVDEPESHLDTANQILFARLLSRLVRTGVKVLVSTHSDYLIKELNNLIMLSSNFESKANVMKRLEYEEADCLDPGRVRAYIAKDNTLVRCEIDKFGIDMPNFDETINSINNVANELAAWLSVKGSE